MPSAIDASKPNDGVPANKQDLRNNLTAARTEIEHAGFVEDFVPVSYRPSDSRGRSHFQAIDRALAGKAVASQPHPHAERGPFDPANVQLDGNAIYPTYIQSGETKFIKGNGRVVAGAEAIVGFESEESSLSWGPEFVAGGTLGADDLPCHLPAGVSELRFVWMPQLGGTGRIAVYSAAEPCTLHPVAASRVLNLADANKTLRTAAATEVTLVVPTDAVAPFRIGTLISVRRGGTGGAGFVPAAGVTINQAVDRTLSARLQHVTIAVQKVALNEWDAFGDYASR